MYAQSFNNWRMNMQVKNIGARGWHVGDKLIAPLDTVELDDKFYNDVKDNAELEVVKGKAKGKTETVAEAYTTAE